MWRDDYTDCFDDTQRERLLEAEGKCLGLASGLRSLGNIAALYLKVSKLSRTWRSKMSDWESRLFFDPSQTRFVLSGAAGAQSYSIEEFEKFLRCGNAARWRGFGKKICG